ncbi:MAG: EAL domain-containing protein (putative c-di-GMP-specific phosphodiesterase class I) [Oceanicoccus sp.]|jgi:EAL domain-containing protein (putative c-di-GMP-specific phosphodiesterase class I)/CheY-like chemotaxis protein
MAADISIVETMNNESWYSDVSLLLLEDQTTQREILAAKFRKLGIGNVVAHADGHSALNLLRQESIKFDIMVVDLILDDMDGLKFLRLAEEQCLKMPAIIFVSAVDDLLLATIRLTAKERGYNLLGAYSKPVSVADLNNALKAYLKQQTEKIDVSMMDFAEQLPASEVSSALKNGELRAFFQPIVSTNKFKEVVAVEALARWNHPVHGEVFPRGFLPMLEHSGLLSDFSKLIVRQSIKQLRRFRDSGLDISVSINMTVLELSDFDWTEELTELVDEYRVPAEKITLEVTEAMALSRNANISETLARLRLKGFGLSIDDFGVGYTSLSNFRRVAFTELKIDRCLTEDLAEDMGHQKIVASIIRLGHDLGLNVVAEAIEDEAGVRLLSELGCDMIQGLAYSPAISPEEITNWCLEKNKRSIE